MQYTVQKLARMTGVSPRTLRYYDEIGLLKPARISSSGYRIYGQPEVDMLQQILFYRELGFGLEQIREIVTDPGFDKIAALQKHRQALCKERSRLDDLIATVEATMAAYEGGYIMKNEDKFAAFKKQLVDDNEHKYGDEIRARYGNQAVEESNRKVLEMSPEKYEEVSNLSEKLRITLAEAFQTKDPGGKLAQQAAELHRQWLGFFWDRYSPEAHMGLVQMYVDDERFTAYYDVEQPGTAAFLRDAVRIYTGLK
ncbi:MAG TPA: MerR family transcriptional regulator [Syntrophomonadaceae bacterium]|nr:MerR family transcriptional regulator [Syntrophomonadaceae bacterium]